jgi:hypothetical protein
MSPRFRRDRDKGKGKDGGGAARPGPVPPGVIPIAEVTWRHRARVCGRVKAVRVQPLAGVPTLECTVFDESGGLAVVFLGRREIPGIQPGTKLAAEGMVTEHQGRLAILNPDYQLLPMPGG